MTRCIRMLPLTQEAFAPFGDVIEARGEFFPINGGTCARFHDLARIEFGDARAGISLAVARPAALPHRLTMVERHPAGSQAFVPMTEDPFLVIVAPDAGGVPGAPLAFLTAPGQGVNYLRHTWHGALTPLGRTARFLILDRIGQGANLEEHRFDAPWTVTAT